MIKLIESIDNNPFDVNDTDMSYYNGIMKDPYYYKFSKGVEGKIIYMTAKRYMDTCTNVIFNGQDAYRAVDGDVVNKYAELMKNGETFPVPILEIRNDYKTQEGRHRMLGAEKLYGSGAKFPVFVVTDAKITRDEMFQHYKKKWGKYMSDNEIEKQFKEVLDELD